jgi:hypothetical protein
VILSAVIEEGGACGTLGTDLAQVIAISVTVDSVVQVADTLRGHAGALTAGGDTVPATIYWASFDTTILAVADSTAGVFVGRQVKTTSLQARTGNLRSNPIPIRVAARTIP